MDRESSKTNSAAAYLDGHKTNFSYHSFMHKHKTADRHYSLKRRTSRDVKVELFIFKQFIS